MMRAGVVGHPIGHSKSPLIHNYWLKKYGVAARYDAFDVLPDDLPAFVKSAAEKGLAGFNVTVPHKVAVMDLLDEVSEAAKKAGAVNTVVVRSDKTLFGDNTDGVGFLENLADGKAGFDIKKAPAVVLGTGGAARGICAAMILAGVPEIRLVGRSQDKADRLARSVGGNFKPVDWSDREAVLAGAGVLANATTLGMNGFEALDINLDNLPQNAVVADLVYAPLETKLLKQAKKKGYATADGAGMLLRQACPAFNAWFGVKPEITEELRELVSQ